MGDDDDAGGRGLLGGRGELDGDLGNVLGLQEESRESVRRPGSSEWAVDAKEERRTHAKVVAVGVGLSLRLVADEDVDEGEDLVDLRLEELGDEGSGEVHGEDLQKRRRSSARFFLPPSGSYTHLVVIGGVLCEDLGRLDTVGEEEASEVEELGTIDEGLDLGGLEVSRLERLGGSKGGAERPSEGNLSATSPTCPSQLPHEKEHGPSHSPVVAGDDDGAGSSGLLRDNLVRADESLLGVGGAELLSKSV